MIRIAKQCRKEIENFPNEIRGDLADLMARLDIGFTLSMPISRPMPSIGKGVHELRLKDRSGVYRLIYVFLGHADIWFLHGFKKKTQATPQQNIELARKRLREIS